MPAIRMLGRRWSFATDDVPMLGFFPTLFHGLWALVLVIIWIIFGKHRDCYDGTTYTVVLAGLLATFTLFTSEGCWTIYEGLKGALLLHFCLLPGKHAFMRATSSSAHAQAIPTRVSNTWRIMTSLRLVAPVSSAHWSCAWRSMLLFNVRFIHRQIFDAGGAGSMFETGRRWRVPYLIYLLALIMLAEIAFNGEAPLKQHTLLCPSLLLHLSHCLLGKWACLLVREASALGSAPFRRLCNLVCGAEAARLRAHAEAVEPSGCREGEPELSASGMTCMASAPVPQAPGERIQGQTSTTSWLVPADGALPVQAICWTTWAIIGVLVVVGLMVFNAFPDYNSQHSWCADCRSSALSTCLCALLLHLRCQNAAVAGASTAAWSLWGMLS